MPLISFSDPAHVSLLLSGKKTQITRSPRKVPLKIGDVLQCYYRPRMVKNTCANCINLKCTMRGKIDRACTSWTNYFGEAVVASILRVRPSDQILKYEMSNYRPLFRDWDVPSIVKWATDDGFSSFQEAITWFGSEIYFKPWDIINFKARWVKV